MYHFSHRLIIFILSLVLLFRFGNTSIHAQDSPSVLYVPLIGITSVPKPLTLPKGPGNVTFSYAVKNFLVEAPLTDIDVVDDSCSPVKFISGDDNHDSKLDYSETWRFSCTKKILSTSESIATATGMANSIKAVHKAYTTVVVDSGNPPPLISVINITKIANPLSLPSIGGKITFTYKVNNPGGVPLNNVTVKDDKCQEISGRLGDTNGNSLLDPNEVWIYTCTATLKQTTTNTVRATGYANDQKAIAEATVTVNVKTTNPTFPNTGTTVNFKITIWKILVGLLIALVLFYLLVKRKSLSKAKKKLNYYRKHK